MDANGEAGGPPLRSALTRELVSANVAVVAPAMKKVAKIKVCDRPGPVNVRNQP